MNIDNRQMKRLMLLISFAVILAWLLYNISGVWLVISRLLSISSPFILGFAIAFVFNSPMVFIEKKLFGETGALRRVHEGVKRPASYLLTLIIFAGIMNIVLFIIVPELVSTIQDLSVKVPSYWQSLQQWTSQNLKDNRQINDLVSSINLNWESIRASMVSFLRSSALEWIGSTFTLASSVLSGITTFALAFVFSIYLLLQKETLIRQLGKLIEAFFPERIADKLFHVGNLSNSVFSSFITGQITEAVILGSLFFVVMVIFKFPYALMISVLIGVTSLVPVFGAFIGCAVGVFLMLVANPAKLAWFLVMFLVIQQIEGNLIYPQVVGKASGLPSIWILVAVTVGGSIMGVAGIILFIPLMSVLYRLLGEYVNYRIESRRNGSNT